MEGEMGRGRKRKTPISWRRRGRSSATGDGCSGHKEARLKMGRGEEVCGGRGMWDLARNVGGEECWRGEGNWGWMWVGRNVGGAIGGGQGDGCGRRGRGGRRGDG